MPLNVALVQVNPMVGDIRGNLRLIREALAAIDDNCQLVAFPECTLPGYPSQDLLLESEFLDELDLALKQLADTIDDKWVIVGTVRRDKSGNLFNTAAVLHQGSIEYRDKSLLPTYDVFDEARYFTPASSIKPVKITLADATQYTIGLQICEDLWDADYPLKVTKQLGDQGVDLFLNISASPFRNGIGEERIALIQKQAVDNGKPFLYVNLVGGQDELVFDGQSMVVDSAGKIIGGGEAFVSETVKVTIEGDTVTADRLPKQLNRLDSIRLALLTGIADYFRKTGHNKAIIGISGGIDSAVVAVLAAAALGPDNVLGIAMPTTYNAGASLDDATALADGLGIRFINLPIEGLRLAMLGSLEPLFGNTEPGLAEENLQARIRGNLLMAVANKTGALVLTTGNKTELALGYATLYGDMAGALAPIGDLSKPEVYALAGAINDQAGKTLIPNRILTKPPTAELRHDQVDPFDYDVVGPLAEEIIYLKRTDQELVTAGYDPALIGDVRRMIRIAEYKRRQAAPVIRITGKAFGVGRRFPIVNGYRN